MTYLLRRNRFPQDQFMNVVNSQGLQGFGREKNRIKLEKIEIQVVLEPLTIAHPKIFFPLLCVDAEIVSQAQNLSVLFQLFYNIPFLKDRTKGESK